MKYEVIFEKNIILKQNDSDLTFEDYKKIEKYCSYMEFYCDKAFEICCARITAIERLPEEYHCVPLRQYFAVYGEENAFIPFRAKAMLEWSSMNKYCSRCGNLLQNSKTFSAKECPECKNIIFPRISPCIIVTVFKDGKVLLANHTYRNQDIYACIAGFMECGESAESAVRREVFEETGLKIKNLKYRESQSWPFPDQLMLGFTAEYESGELKLQKEEIADAKWFDPENCPASPKPGSIAYRLIHNKY